jgi:predicted nucleic acid-binding protein
MVLVDTSVWVNHLRQGDAVLSSLLDSGQVLVHQFVLGELALGSMRHRAEILALLGDLPQAVVAADDEVLDFIERHALMSLGIGYIDVHLLVSARLSSVLLWTQDKRLHEVAARLGLAAYHTN